jgi:hypothetical protein
MTYDDLLTIAHRFEGRTLETVTGTRFKVGIYRDCAFFTGVTRNASYLVALVAAGRRH